MRTVRLSRLVSRAALWCLVVTLLAVSAGEAKKKKKSKNVEPEELFNPLLGVDYSHWLVGPVYHLASAEEVAAYLDLIDDEEAKSFVEKFWAERNEGTGFFDDSPQEIFEQRAHTADGRYSEGSLPGRRTDRGTIFILFGEAEEIEYESSDKVGGAVVEVWTYPKDAEEGLGGEAPKRSYRFIEVGEHTVFLTNQSATRREFDDRRTRKPRF